MKRKKSNPVVLIVTMVVITAIVIAAFFYLRDRALKKNEELREKSEVNRLISIDLENNYPGNAREVLKLHNRFMKCYYNEELSEEDVEKLAMQNYKLFDEELKEKNPQETYIKNLKREIMEYKESKRSVVNDRIQEFTDAEREVKGGYNFCNLLVSYMIKEDKFRITTNQKFYLREDKEEKWKILFWELTKKTF